MVVGIGCRYIMTKKIIEAWSSKDQKKYDRDFERFKEHYVGFPEKKLRAMFESL